MSQRTSRSAVVTCITVVCRSLLIAGCTSQSPATVPAAMTRADAGVVRLAADLGAGVAETQTLAAPAGTCGGGPAPVLRLILPEPVLFATASDQPAPRATTALDAIAGRIRRDAPGRVLTVLGHTDAVGSDAYNIDLSKRRAATVLRALLARGLDPDRLGAVAIGKRQPIASNATPEGRARNRRVEFLIADCLAANLAIVAGAARNRTLLGPDADATDPVAVMRLDPIGVNGISAVGSVSLAPAEGEPPVPAAALPPQTVAKPAPSPHYQPRSLAPDVQRNPLGPAVPF